jgi:hypothetical protein
VLTVRASSLPWLAVVGDEEARLLGRQIRVDSGRRNHQSGSVLAT